VKCVQIEQKNHLKIAQIWYKNAKPDKDFTQNRLKDAISDKDLPFFGPQKCYFADIPLQELLGACAHTAHGLDVSNLLQPSPTNFLTGMNPVNLTVRPPDSPTLCT
jgi:hypothetical protein